jgi:hypothetical protein
MTCRAAVVRRFYHPGAEALHSSTRLRSVVAGRDCASSAESRAEEEGLAAIADTGGIEIFVEELLELVMGRHFVTLAAFLVQPQPPALAVRKVVLGLPSRRPR